jgi:streptogramin lyase
MRRLFVLCLSLLVVASLAVSAGAGEPRVSGRLLVPGARVPGGTWGMAFDQADHLWVGSIAARQVTELNANTGRILARYGPDQGAEGADDVAVGPDGAVYYTAIMTGEVGRIGPDGAHSTVVNLGPGVNPITFSDDGRLFVGRLLMGVGLFEVYLDGVTPPREIITDISTNGFEWWDGYLYAPRTFDGDIVKIDVETGDFTTVVSGLTYPVGVDIGPDGRMFVVDAGTVFEFDPDTGATTAMGAVPGGYGDNLAIDSAGRIFVSGGTNGAIWRLRPNGTAATISAPGLAGPAGLAVLSEAGGRETVYAADIALLYGFGGASGRRLLLADAPFIATVSADGANLVLSSWMTNTVQTWSPSTGLPINSYADFAVPLNAIRFDGDLIVAELGTGRVVRMDEATGERQTLAQLIVPAGLAGNDKNLWAADWATGTVYQLVRQGRTLHTPRPVVTGLQGPEGMAVTADGDLLVVETWAQRLSLIVFGAAGATVVPLVEDLAVGQPAPAGLPPTWTFDGVAVGPSGVIYVSAAGIYRYVRYR